MAKMKKKAPIVRYVCLAILFAGAIAYQYRATEFSFPEFLDHDVAGWPFTPVAAGGKLAAIFVIPSAQKAGMHERDEVIAIDGEPFTGTAIFGEALAHARPGDPLIVEVKSTGDQAPRTVVIPLQKARFGGTKTALALIVAYKIGLPVLCILLGFWVAAVRPRDPSAWCLLFVLLGLSALSSGGEQGWGRGIRDVAAGYRAGLNELWPLFMLLFGIYFPEPFAKKGPAIWGWAKRIFIPVLILLAAIGIIIAIGTMEDYAAIASLQTFMARIYGFSFSIELIAAGSFFGCIQAKLRGASTPDAKRRLKLLYLGATVGMTPTFIMVVAGLVMRKQVEQIFPEWIVLCGLVVVLIFPITLAYVIVVQRALDVRVVIRQGLQYALAKNGIIVLQIAITAGVLFVALSLAMNPTRSRAQSIPLLAIGMTIVFLLQRFARKLRAWTDRKFFRDAYNAEQILAGLSDEVRTIVETSSLVERVASRIAESLHVPQVAVLLDDGGWYRPAYALGYAGALQSSLPERDAAVQRLRSDPEPARVYLEDEKSWINSPGVKEEEKQRLAELDARVLLPLSVKDNLLGIITLGEKKSEEPYSSSDLKLLKSVAAQTGLALANARLTATIAEEIARREKMNRELEIAREVQERLFPQNLPPVPGLDYAGCCRTALGVGGDYYDFLALPEGKLGMALGDVSGKGIAAALMMASLQASLRAEAARAGNEIGAMIGRVNRMVFDASAEDRYATLFYAQFDPATGKIIYVNGGHCPPMLFRKRCGIVERLEGGGPVVGLMRDCAYEQGEAWLEPGDMLVIYTDGISEAMNQNLEEWGEQRLITAIQNTDGVMARDKIAEIVKAADAFANGAPQHDDMTLMILNATPADSSTTMK